MKHKYIPGVALFGILSAVLLWPGGSASAATTIPTVTKISLTKGAYSFVLGKKTVKLKPFPGYTGAVWARKVSFGKNLGAEYLFVPQAKGTNSTSDMKYYNTNFGQMRSLSPFYGKHTLGYNADIVVQPKTGMVFLAFGTKEKGVDARIVQLGRRGITQVNNPTTADTADKGQVLVKFLKMYTNEYALATMIADKPGTLKIWRYSTKTERFDEDTTTSKAAIQTADNNLHL